jgi:multidrug resistance efflux pump
VFRPVSLRPSGTFVETHVPECWVVRDRQATFDNSERNFRRAQELVEGGFISRTEYDRLEANFKTSEAALVAAKQDLAYT